MTTPWFAVDQCMNQAVQSGVFPAGEILVAHQGDIVWHDHYGDCNSDTIFDLASLTKPLVVSTRIMQLLADGDRIVLDTPLGKLFPTLGSVPYSRATLRETLEHRAGFPAWQALYKDIDPDALGTPQTYLDIIRATCMTTPLGLPGKQHCYSDLGYIVLGAILEDVAGIALEHQWIDNIARPLGLDTLFYRPTPGSLRRFQESFPTSVFAPTSECDWRKRVLRGEVDDRNCYAMGGVSGHAGLFGQALDIHALVYQLVASYRGHSDWIPQPIVQKMLHFDPDRWQPGTHLGGWDTPAQYVSSAGKHFSKHTIGHLGFTGGSIWIDLKNNCWVIALTNRVHPDPKNTAIKAWRPTLHDAVMQELGYA